MRPAYCPWARKCLGECLDSLLEAEKADMGKDTGIEDRDTDMRMGVASFPVRHIPEKLKTLQQTTTRATQ
jgi:hypothetical protein